MKLYFLSMSTILYSKKQSMKELNLSSDIIFNIFFFMQIPLNLTMQLLSWSLQ